MLGIAAITTSLRMYRQGIKDPLRNRFRLMVQTTRILTNMVSPDLEAEITYTVRTDARTNAIVGFGDVFILLSDCLDVSHI
jgi:hypothetical protein